MSDSQFRLWMNHLLSPRRELADWPQQLLWLVETTFQSEQSHCRRYLGESILIDRQHLAVPEHSGEKRAAYGLYQLCQMEPRQGILSVGDQSYWLISCEVPNQDSERGRRADLVGLSLSGGLCVFECKLGTNGYSPLAALFEGLDYLACLSCEANFTRIQEEFDKLRRIRCIPHNFELVRPRSDAQHEVIVLADRDYYAFHSRRDLARSWQLLNQLQRSASHLKLSLAEARLNDSDIYDPDTIRWCSQ